MNGEAWNLEPGTWNLEPGTWNLEPWNPGTLEPWNLEPWNLEPWNFETLEQPPAATVGISAPDDPVRIYNMLRLER